MRNQGMQALLSLVWRWEKKTKTTTKKEVEI